MTSTAAAAVPQAVLEPLPEKSYWRTNTVIVCFLAAYTGKYLLVTSQNQVMVSKDIDGGEKVPFDHPFFQMVAAYLGEFVFTIFYYIYKAFLMQYQVRWTEIRYMQFLYVALCDFTENLLFIFGLSYMLPGFSLMTKAIALPFAALFSKWSLLKIRKNYNWKQIASICGILIGVLWVAVASYHLQKDWFTAQQLTGFLMLVLSAMFQALEIALESRLFRIDDQLTALGLQQAVSIWKVILIFVLFVVTNIFADSLGQALGSDMEHFALINKNLGEDSSLYYYMASLMMLGALAANLGMQVVKDENAVFKQSMMLLPIPILWVYHMNYGQQKDSFSVMKLIGQVILVGCVFTYMWADRVAVAEEEANKPKKNKNKRNPYNVNANNAPGERRDTTLPPGEDEETGHLMSLNPTNQDETEMPSFVAASRRNKFDTNKLKSEGTSSAAEHSDELESSVDNGSPERNVKKVD